tara:strand:+ start:2069 stop:2776 length:708 start_codon:yes stop_codon:yes gene_type:complete
MVMTKTIVLTMIAAVGIASAGSASADSVATGLSFGATGTYTTQDIWRGQNQGDDDFRLDLTTDLDLLGVPSFASLAWSENDNQNEMEFSLGAAHGLTLPVLGGVTGNVVFNYYSEGTDIVGDVKSELGLGLSFANYSVTQFVALDGDNDSYGEIGADFGELYEGIFVTGTLGYLLEDLKATHIEVVAKLPDFPVRVLDTSISPFVKGVYTFDGREGIWTNDGFEVVGGIGLSRSF